MMGTRDQDSHFLPIAFTTPFLLDLLRVGVDVTAFGEVAWEMLLRLGGTIGEAVVVTIVLLMRASH